MRLVTSILDSAVITEDGTEVTMRVFLSNLLMGLCA